MKRTVLVLVLLFVIVAPLYATEQQLSFEQRHRDKNSLFLEYSQTIRVNEDWSYRKEEYKKLKILKEEGRYMGEIPMPYEKGQEEVVEISAYTITPDGRRHKYTKVQDVSEYALYPIYSDAMVKIVTMPAVNVGSIIECKVVTESKGKQIKDAFWEEFYLTLDVPTKLLKTTIIFPNTLNIQYKEFNLTHKPKITKDQSTITYAWEIYDVYDERISEDYVPPPTANDIQEGVEFSSIASWSDISNWYYGLIQKNLKITPEIEQAAQNAIEGRGRLRDRVRAVLEYIQDNFRYVSMSFGSYSLEPHPTDEVFKNKYGDCKDLSLLCMAMLKAAGIESDIALFRDEFSITDPQFDLPMPSLFDHVLVLVRDGKDGDFYIDCLLKGYDLGEYPLYYQNAYTFIITESGGEFGRLPIFSGERTYTKRETTTIINPDGTAKTETYSLWDLDASIQTRENLKRMNDTQREEIFQKLDAMFAAGGEVIERKIDNLDKRYGNFRSHLIVRQRDAYLVSDGLIILDVKGYQREIELTKEKRDNPLFFPGNTCHEEITTYYIPKGFRVLSLPEDVEKDIGFFSIKRVYKSDKDKIVIKETTRQKRIEIPTEDYAKVKEFFDKLPRDTCQRIVLKKTKSLWQEMHDMFSRFFGKLVCPKPRASRLKR